MKKAILILLLLPLIASAQLFRVFDIDTSEYPIMKAKFYSVDENGDQILNHTTSDFEITENGSPAEVLSVSCPDPLPIPISVGIMVDTYYNINLARHGAERFVNFLKMPQNEIGFTYMDGRPLLFQDFTKDKSKVRNSSKQIPPAPGGASVSEMFFDEYAGGIELIKNREAQNRVLIFVSDLHCPNLNIDEQELIQQAKDNKIKIYTVLLGTTDYTGLFTRIADNTNGNVFENVRDSSEIEDIFEGIVFREQNDPCEITWNGSIPCERLVELNITNYKTDKIYKHKYELHEKQTSNLSFLSHFIRFEKINKGEVKDTTVLVSAFNEEQIINEIEFIPDYNNFTILNPLPVKIKNGRSINLKLQFSATDTNHRYTKLVLKTNKCNFSVGIVTGDDNIKLSERTLEVITPNGGELYFAGKDSIIKWDGISKNEKTVVKFSSDNGRNWINLKDSAYNLTTNWKVPSIQSDSCLVSVSQYHYQNKQIDMSRDIEWKNIYGGKENDELNSTIQLNDGGYLSVGGSKSTDGNLALSGNRGNYDAWVMNTDSFGEVQWSKTYGGSGLDILNSVIQTKDEGYILAGKTNSQDVDLEGLNSKGDFDAWIMKVDKNGSIEWSRIYGGTRSDLILNIVETQDEGFLALGTTMSNDHDLSNSGNNGLTDAWVIKFNSDGYIEWSKTYGGSSNDYLQSIVTTVDGGYIFAGGSSSSDGDLMNSGNKGGKDIWVLKVNKFGIIEWSKTYGGSDVESANDIKQTVNYGFIVVGYSSSNDGDLSNVGIYGSSDIWVLKLNSFGNLEWSETYGGSSHESALKVINSNDYGYIVAGHSQSTNGDLEGLSILGEVDLWIFKLNPLGEREWSETYGGSKSERLKSMFITKDKGFILNVTSDSQNGDVQKFINENNYENSWILKFAPPIQPLQSDTSDAVFSIIIPEPVIQNNDIDMGEMIVGSTKDTIVSSVICNTGDAPLHVLGVDISTIYNSDDFLIPRGAGDFYLEKDECQDMMFEFTPSVLGNRTAVATIRTTIGDFTDIINIRGVGIDPLIEATTDVVDFGQFELGDGKDTNVVLIKNVGTDDITITETKITGPDMEQFTLLTNPTSYTIAAGLEEELELNYTARYGGRTSSIIEFHYDGVGSPLRSMLFAEGIGGEVYPQVPDAYVGERVELGLHLGRIKPEGLDEVATNFTATVSYNSTLLAPIDKNMTVTTENTTSFIEIEGQLSGATQIATVPMKVGLGTAVSSGLVVIEFQLYNANGDSVEYEIEPGVGEFNVLGICEEGGTRLINPNGEQVELKVTQDQMNTNATVSLNLIESGQTDLIIYDQLGNAVETVYSGKPSTGTKEINIDLSQYANGRYYIKLITPTITKTEIIEVVR